MYDPASADADWEWVEITNLGEETVELAGFVLDDSSTSAHTEANVNGGLIPAGGTAILYNGDAVSDTDFRAAWGDALNLVAVTGWSRLSLNNSGDSVGLWRRFRRLQRRPYHPCPRRGERHL